VGEQLNSAPCFAMPVTATNSAAKEERGPSNGLLVINNAYRPDHFYRTDLSAQSDVALNSVNRK
jgi:hypothetical protein